jgi:hypothetical protein
MEGVDHSMANESQGIGESPRQATPSVEMTILGSL